jgi:hypothetical protein
MGLLALLSAALLGYCGVRLWLPDAPRSSSWIHALRASLGIGLGIGGTSCLYFLLLLGGVAKAPVVWGCELVALCVLAALVVRQRPHAVQSENAVPEVPAFSWNWLLGLGLAAMLAIFIAGFVSASDANPQGGWDAFAIWNLRARYLLHSETWRYAVTALPVGTHMEYPLLLSSAIARAWQLGGDTGPLAPIALAALFPLATVLVLVSALSLNRRTSLGLLAGVVFLANPAVLNQATNQYSDLPLAFFALAALALVTMGSGSVRYLSLAGLFAGFATWTKNEGMLLFAAIAVALFAGAWRSGGLRRAARDCAVFVAGAGPMLALTLWFKFAVSPPDPLAGQMGSHLAQRLLAPDRWLHIVSGFLSHAWALALPLALLAGAAGLLRPRLPNGRALAPWIAFSIGLAGYFGVFLATSYELDWLLGTALDRLYLHLWPLLVLAVFFTVRCPEEFAAVETVAAVAGKGKGKKGR